MDRKKALKGAQMVIKEWLDIKSCDNLLIVTDKTHREEGLLLKEVSEHLGCETDIVVTEKEGKLVGMYYDSNPHAFDGYDYIIGATDYSLVTTVAAKTAIKNGSNYLSLPLHTNDGRSMLEYDFLNCDTQKSKTLASALIGKLHSAGIIHVTTTRGTDIYFYKKDRHAKFFNGKVNDCDGYSSASIEVYVPLEETRTHGSLVLDVSYGYIGKLETPFEVLFSCGKITSIEASPDGNKLQNFIDDYCDDKMFVASEFGIGLNPLSHCDGNCYIEDESALGTFHIGLGRNLALGGIWEASGHFDLTSQKPDVYADGFKIMHNGQIIV
ncbi:MAG: peptidase [Oscillospiraceae bacterium]|nr:peptidase [Oscillospiraceae bacterium]